MSKMVLMQRSFYSSALVSCRGVGGEIWNSILYITDLDKKHISWQKKHHFILENIFQAPSLFESATTLEFNALLLFTKWNLYIVVIKEVWRKLYSF